MDPQKQVIETVKKWVQLDNQIKHLSATLKQIRKDKSDLNVHLLTMMKDNSIDIFSIKDGQLQYKKETKRKPLSQKSLLTILSKYPQFSEDQASLLNAFIYENREIFVKESIARKETAVKTDTTTTTPT